MNIENMPILQSLLDYQNENGILFHMPGHKRGQAYEKAGLDYLRSNLLQLDVTEVPGIDNLHCPEGPILKAQEMAARTFGADYSFFLANGTTSGIYAMILSVTEPGDKIIVPRNCHRSVAGAIILGRLIPVYLNPEIDSKLQVAMGIRPEAIEQALVDNPEAKAVVITNPTYYGACSDIKRIAEIVHRYKKILLVDEAHGAHFKFNGRLPMSALDAGADMAAQSTHKTLPSMTQSSMLHVKSKSVDLEKLKFFLQLVQSTSPSHILLASLDMARYVMETDGEKLLEDTIEWSNSARKALNAVSGVYCLGHDRIGSFGIYDIDETRLTVNFSEIGLNGHMVNTELRKRFGLQVEMSDLNNVVAITTVGDSEASYRIFVKGIEEIAKENLQKNVKENVIKDFVNILLNTPEMALMPWEAIYCEKEDISFNESIGRISAEMIIPYPPGIPVILQGEIITKEIMQYCRHCLENGININGVKDSKLNSISVIKF